MSMYAYVKGISDADKVKKAEEGIKTLKELGFDFNGKGKDVLNDLEEIIENDVEIPTNKFNTEYEEVIEVNVKDIPKEVEKIQFIISY